MAQSRAPGSGSGSAGLLEKDHDGKDQSIQRQVLAAHYRLDGHLPSNISNQIFNKQSSIISDILDQDEEHEKKLLIDYMQDGNVSAKIKGKVAKALLTGNYDVEPTNDTKPRPITPVNPSKAVIDAEFKAQQLLLLNRHNLPKPRFLEVVTESTAIPTLSKKALREEQMKHIREKRKTIGFTASTMMDSISSEPSHVHILSPNIHATREAQMQALARSSFAKHMADDRRYVILLYLVSVY
jgi:hypothetical protein